MNYTDKGEKPAVGNVGPGLFFGKSGNRLTPSLQYLGFHHVELWVGNALQVGAASL